MSKFHPKPSFASDNCAPVHPAIMQALQEANVGHAPSYGSDYWTAAVSDAMNTVFGRPVTSFLMMNGTGANVAALAHVMRGYTGVICADVAHINTNETGAPERIAGAKLIPLPTKDGKLTPAQIETLLHMQTSEHYCYPAVVALTQATEFGCVYTPTEVAAIAAVCHANDMLLYMDGARIANAAAYLGVNVSAFTCEAGVDIVAFGGTKNGLMYGECLVFFDEALAKRFEFTRKSTGQLASKMRYIAVQFLALLQDDLWLTNAHHANTQARALAAGIAPFFTILHPVEANEVFCVMDDALANALQETFEFGGHDGSYRLVTSFDTTDAQVHDFIERAKKIASVK